MQDLNRSREGRRPEKDPPDDHGKKGRKPAPDSSQRRGDLLRSCRSQAVIGAEVEAVEAAPDDEVPRRPVPESAQQHRHGKVAVAAEGSLAAAAERDVEIISQEG